MKVVILAGGLGTRLSEETTVRPKPMVEIGGRPILWHIMKLYSSYGYNDFIICVGYKGYVIKEFFSNYNLHMSDVTFDYAAGTTVIHRNASEPWRVTVVDTGEATQTGGRVGRIRQYVENDPFFALTYGDGLSDVDIAAEVAFHEGHGRLATVAAVRPTARFGAMVLDGPRVTTFAEKPKKSEGWINGGFFVLSPGIFDLLEDDRTIWEHGPLERLASGDQLRAFVHQGFWQPMDTLRDRTYLEDYWTSGQAPWKRW